MRNVEIRGGRMVGPPQGWDQATQGECLTLSVLRHVDDTGVAHITAWQFGEAELNALQAGGHLFVADVIPFIHLRRIFVQDGDGGMVSELVGSSHGVRPVDVDKQRLDHARMREIAGALRAAIISIGIDLETRVREGGLEEDWRGADNAGIVERLARLVGMVRPASDTVRLPVLKLGDLVPGARAGFTATAVSPAAPGVQAELERLLGINLNPTHADDATDDDERGKCSFCEQPAVTDVSGASEVFPCCAGCAAAWEKDREFIKNLRADQAAPPTRLTFDWLRIARAAGEHGVRYRTNGGLMRFLDAIRPPATNQAVELDWTRTKAFEEAAAECMRAAEASTFADTVSEDERKGYRSACNLMAMNFRLMASHAAPELATQPAKSQDGEA